VYANAGQFCIMSGLLAYKASKVMWLSFRIMQVIRTLEQLQAKLIDVILPLTVIRYAAEIVTLT
jgi:hypothetical protein